MKEPIQNLFTTEISVSEGYKEFIKRCLALNAKERITPNEIFNYRWPMAQSHVEGVVEKVKSP